MLERCGKYLLLVMVIGLVTLMISPGFGQTDTSGRGKLYQLMIKNMVEFQKVIVAMAQNRWDAAYQEIEKQNEFADQVLELYPKKTIEDIRDYKKLAREIKDHVDNYKKFAAKKSDKRAQQEFCAIFSLCIECHTKFRD